MIRFLVSIALHLVANAIGLIVAAMFLDDMSLDGVAFVIALLIFTGVEVIAQPLIRKIAFKHRIPARQCRARDHLRRPTLTDLISDGLDIQGLWTWVLATIIVWLGVLLQESFFRRSS